MWPYVSSCLLIPSGFLNIDFLRSQSQMSIIGFVPIKGTLIQREDWISINLSTVVLN